MVEQVRWFERTFDFNQPVGVFPCILERFRGTPARLEDAVRRLDRSVLTTRVNDRWSMQEHAGHLWDLEELGERRLVEFLAHASTLSPADRENRKTFAANHNGRPIAEILSGFRNAREHLTGKLEKLNEAQVAFSSIHPRLGTPMRLIDWVCFMAEHDDHHLARIRGLMRLLDKKIMR
jgi:hypothetical protein